MKIVDVVDTSSGYRAVVHLHAGELELIRDALRRDLPRLKELADFEKLKYGYPLDAVANLHIAKAIVRRGEIDEAIKKLAYANSRRIEGRRLAELTGPGEGA